MRAPADLPLNPAASAGVPPSGAVDARSGAFLPHVHALRGVAILFVVGAHCWPEFGWSREDHAALMLLFDNVTAVFMFISGLLFQHLSARFDYRRYLRHRFTILVLPYVVTSIPAILAVVFVTHRHDVWPWVYDLPVWQQLLFFLATGKHLAPLWFIPMMVLFVLAAPLFVWIDRRDLYPWLLPAALAFAVMLGRDSIAGPWGVFGKAVFMLPAYLAGMAFSRHRAAAERWCDARMGLLAAGFALLSVAMLAGPPGDLTIVQKLLLALLLLALARRFVVREGWLGIVAKWSFAIYFVHGYVISGFRTLWQAQSGLPHEQAASGVIFPPSYLGLVADIACVTLISMAIIAVARRVLGSNSRMLIGA